jgi:radical SAM enzyme (rSAM/lipoprotein system)
MQKGNKRSGIKQNLFSWRQRVALDFHALYVQYEAKIHELQYFFWECTARCNLACLHCGSDCRVDNTLKDMPLNDFLNVCKSVSEKYDPSNIMIVITGGEPLLRKDLEEMGNALVAMGFSWGMVTNGFLLTNERFRSLRRAGLSSITISLDGFEKEHEWLRGIKGSFSRAVEAAQLVASESGMIYDVVTCVNQRNIHYLHDFKNFLQSMGVKYWRLFVIDPIGRARYHDELFLNKEQLHTLLGFIASEREKGEMKVSFGCDGFLGEYERKVRDGFFFCRAGIHVASILANGDIGACPNIHRGFVQGNIYTDDFIEVWEKRFKIFRNRKREGQCRTCEIWSWCRGDGMHLHEPDREGPIHCYFQQLYL